MVLTQAIVAREPTADHGFNWSLEDLEVSHPKENEVLVEMYASGICHTDVVISSIPSGTSLGIGYPKVVGHEGAGFVREIEENVKSVQIGDPVLLSFYSCSACEQCQAAHPAYCHSFGLENLIGRQGAMKTKHSEDVWSRFFGHSSFTHYSIVAERSVINAKDLLRNTDELKLFAPLGCGLQTGMGAIQNITCAGSNDVVVILGMGAVGMGALMTANIRECEAIIAVDRYQDRLELSKSLGATHTIDTSTMTGDLNDAVRRIFPTGATVVLDTTGVPTLIQDGLRSCRAQGKLVLIGVPPFGWEMNIPAGDHINSGRSVLGCVEGDCIPTKDVPQMIQWYREGRFPLDKLVTYFPVTDFKEAMALLSRGDVIKPVLVWEQC